MSFQKINMFWLHKKKPFQNEQLVDISYCHVPGTFSAELYTFQDSAKPGNRTWFDKTSRFNVENANSKKKLT